MSTAACPGRVVLVHGPAHDYLDLALESSGLHRIAQIGEVAIWVSMEPSFVAADIGCDPSPSLSWAVSKGV
ncbi:MAG TPA: hypothetical protein VG435_20430 [Acidimicrobiales bacterium]|jgi:hypothetical protein|nr:hypothetical protein [Acidimicrobiales bacterium]